LSPFERIFVVTAGPPSTLRIGIVGLGYVGLPLGLAFAKAGNTVLGFDTDPAKIEALAKGTSYIHHSPSAEIAETVKAGRLSATCDFSRAAEPDAIVICVPTPLTINRVPDLTYVEKTAHAIAPHIRKGQLIVLESTTYPGTTDEVMLPILEKGSGLKAGTDFHLAYSPEREDPGNPNSKLRIIPKVVGGLTPRCRELAERMYTTVVERVVPVSSCRAAEATKLLENIFRAVNIALVNELKVVYKSMGIDVWEVIEAAKTKPFGFMAFYPGPGLGGHCIPIDPFYLTWKALEYGQHTRLIELAGEINGAMPSYVVSRVGDALNDSGKSIKGSRILVLGLAYKPNVDDDRESPTYEIMHELEAKGANVDYNDPYVPKIRPGRSNHAVAGRPSRPITADYDALVLCTQHDEYRDFDFAALGVPLVDARNHARKKPARYYPA
jgi:UDP-N-acetyl-D-glucosamine dehydrogenase